MAEMTDGREDWLPSPAVHEKKILRDQRVAVEGREKWGSWRTRSASL